LRSNASPKYDLESVAIERQLQTPDHLVRVMTTPKSTPRCISVIARREVKPNQHLGPKQPRRRNGFKEMSGDGGVDHRNTRKSRITISEAVSTIFSSNASVMVRCRIDAADHGRRQNSLPDLKNGHLQLVNGPALLGKFRTQTLFGRVSVIHFS